MSARVAEWSRGEFLWQVNPPPAGFGIFVGGLGPPSDTQATLLRTIVHARLSAQVVTSTGLVAPAGGWTRMAVRWVANHVSDGSGTIGDPDSPDDSIVAIGWMVPRAFPPVGGGSTYYVVWELEAHVDSSKMRKVPLGVGSSAAVNLAFFVDDVDGWFRHVTPYNIQWSSWWYLETLWLNQP